MKEEFNVGTPTKENIEYAFKNLIFYVTASVDLNLYKIWHKRFENVLKKINKVLSIYINNGNLMSIDEKTLQNIKFDLIDLDTQTKSLKSYFAEWSLLWLDAIISLRISEINKGGFIDGK